MRNSDSLSYRIKRRDFIIKPVGSPSQAKIQPLWHYWFAKEGLPRSRLAVNESAAKIHDYMNIFESAAVIADK